MIKLSKLSISTVLKIMNIWPPYLGAGIKPKLIDPYKLIISVSMSLNWSNRNYVNTHFGGSLYSMVDPFYMLILLKKLGPDYLVWDKSASIEFKSPGRTKVFAQFEVSEEQLENIKKTVENLGKCEPKFLVNIKDQDNNTVAIVHKTLWVRKKI